MNAWVRHGILFGLLITAGQGTAGSNVLPNGAFDHPDDPLHGWTTDYRWNGNRNDRDNHERVAVLPHLDGRRQVLRLQTHPQTKAETLPIALEPGARYRCTLWMKGGRGRFYFCGYRPAPGIPPDSQPTPETLRPVYRSRTIMESSRTWKRVSFEFPAEGDASPTAQRHLQSVRYFTLYIWTGDTEAPPETFLYVDHVEIIRIR